MTSTVTWYRAPYLPGNDVANATSETQMPNARATPLILPLPSNGTLANRLFRVVLSGRVQTTANVTFQMNLYFGFSKTIASNTQIFTTGAISVNALNSNFNWWVDMTWDSTSLTITGRGEGFLANMPIGPGILSSSISNVDPNRDSSTTLASGATYGFTVTGTFGSSSTGNHAFVDAFDLESR